MKANEIIKKATEVYGLKHQSMMAVEEMAELQKELCKYQRYGNNIDNIAEEVADVEIMLEQLKVLFDCHMAVENWKVFKLERLEKRL